MSLRLWGTCLLSACVLTACGGAPPNKEMDQALGAIDAARAAGADKYATTEFTAATDGLKRAQNSVGQRDYRQALQDALDSREHAQNAAREAADSKAQVRGEVERDMAQIAALIAEANSRLAAASKTRMPRRTLDASRKALATVDDNVQKAGAAMKADDYLAAKADLQGVREQITQATSALAPATAQSSRRSR